jgi:hypothetical protein
MAGLDPVPPSSAQPSDPAPVSAPEPVLAGTEGEEVPVRRRRNRPARAENGSEPQEAGSEDTTPDGAAALAAFPD